MKTSEQRVSETRRQHAEAVIARHLCQLFRRLPMLCGFWLRPNLQVQGVSVLSSSGGTTRAELYEQIAQSVVDLTDEHPDAAQLIRGRTFARAVH